MASNVPDNVEMTYTCEICGLDGFTDETMRGHSRTCHVEGRGSCPFCDLAAVSPAELSLHVNQVHLDFLTPETETMSFIDEDNTPNSVDGEHDWGDKACGGPIVGNINVDRGYGGGEGSPLRSQLALKLKSNSVPVPAQVKMASPSPLQCPLCPHRSDSPTRLEEHINRQHFDPTSPMLGPANDRSTTTTTMTTTTTTMLSYPCPLCSRSFSATADLELHVNIEHRDVLSPGKASPAAIAAASSHDGSSCPVCGISLDPLEVARHVEAHFPASTPDQRESQRVREQHEFDLLRAQYGMDNQGNFREQSVANMQRAVYAGEMSVADYYERQLELKAAESYGVDDGSSVTRNIVSKVRGANPECLTCTNIDHYASSYGDRGWGCGYRNAQMLLSSLLTHTGYNELLYHKLWSPQNELPPRTAIPSISRLQLLIEAAWAQGFDLQGSEQLGCRLHNTRKWIGATEVVTLLSSLRIRCQLVDFHRPTGIDGTHPELFAWVLNYFQNSNDFVPPLYLQHQGHSRTIMGVECGRDGNITLLVLDPSHSPQQMSQFGCSSSVPNAMRLLRKGTAAMKARQYQLVAVVGTIDSEVQYQQSKVLRGIRIPQDR